MSHTHEGNCTFSAFMSPLTATESHHLSTQMYYFQMSLVKICEKKVGLSGSPKIKLDGMNVRKITILKIKNVFRILEMTGKY